MANNIFIDFLPPWIETGVQPAFYDKESGTVLQQTARMYAKVNELTQSVNDYIEQFIELHDYVHDYFDNLDVQEEINNKLDDMASDGSLTTLISNYLQPLVDAQNERIGLIENQVTSVASGSPLVASSTSGMTDTTRVYVNTTDGKWYYYDGDSWEIGGTYQSSGISDGSIDILMFDDPMQSNYFMQFGEPLDLGNAYEGYYKTNGDLVEANTHMNYHYSLVNGKTYFFTGENNYQCAGLVIKDSSNNLIYQSQSDTSTRANFSRVFKCNQNNLTAYISMSSSMANTSLLYYSSMLRELSGVFNMLKYSNTIPLIQTIGGFLRADRAGSNKIEFVLGQSGASTKMYQMSKGRTYKIHYINYSNICDLMVCSSTNAIIYASSTSNLGDNVSEDDYTFTATQDGYILLTTFTQHSVEEVPHIEVVNDSVNIVNADSNIYGKRISYNGDSICIGAGYNGGYGKIIGEKYNMIVENIAVGGATIATDTYSGANPRHWISSSVTDMNSNYDFAILEGGVNDSSLNVPLGEITEGYDDELDTTTYYGAFEYMLKNLISRFKGKKYGYIAVHQMTRNYRVVNNESTSYYWASKKCCEKWGVPFLDLNVTVPPFAFLRNTSLSSLPTTYTKDGDGWHPNEDGYKKYYVDKIVAWLESL